MKNKQGRWGSKLVRWTTAERQILATHYAELGAHGFGSLLPLRAPNAIRQQARLAGLKAPRKAASRNWSKAELEILQRVLPDQGIAAAARALPNRSVTAIVHRAYLLGMSSASRWTSRELNIVRRYYPKEGPQGVCRRLPNRTRMAVCQAASGLNLRVRRKPIPKARGRRKSDRRSPWSKQEIRLFLEHYPKGGLARVVPRLPGRSIDAIRWRVQQYRLRAPRALHATAGTRRSSVVVAQDPASDVRPNHDRGSASSNQPEPLGEHVES